MYTYAYPRPIVCTDIILVNDKNEILLVKRGVEPEKGSYCFPGGHVGEDENSKMACIRELKEETGLIVNEKDLLLITVAENEWRDSRRQWCMSVVYSAEIFTGELKAGDDAAEVEWVSVSKIKNGEIDLAFDHNKIFSFFLKYLNILSAPYLS